MLSFRFKKHTSKYAVDTTFKKPAVEFFDKSPVVSRIEGNYLIFLKLNYHNMCWIWNDNLKMIFSMRVLEFFAILVG